MLIEYYLFYYIFFNKFQSIVFNLFKYFQSMFFKNIQFISYILKHKSLDQQNFNT